jgi:hypothetical protein
MYGQWIWREGSHCSQDPGRLVIGYGYAYVDATGEIIPDTCQITSITYTDQAATWDVSDIPKPHGEFVVIDIECTADGKNLYLLGYNELFSYSWSPIDQNYNYTNQLWGDYFYLNHGRDMATHGNDFIYATGASVENENDWSNLSKWKPTFWGYDISSKNFAKRQVTDRAGVGTLGNFYGVERNPFFIINLYGPTHPSWGMFSAEGEGDITQKGNDLNVDSVIDQTIYNLSSSLQFNLKPRQQHTLI